MSSIVAKKSIVSLLKKINIKVRYGLTLQSIRFKLITIGIDISPYYWYQEGVTITKIPEIQGIPADYSFESLGPDDMKTIETLDKGWSRSNERLLALSENKEKCLGIKYKGEIAAFMWINFVEFKYKSTVMPLKSNEAYLTEMFTVEAYRGKNLAPFLRYKSYEMLKEMGRDVLYSISICFNSPAVKYKEKLNARKLKIILYIRLFKKFHRSFTLKSY
jgi:hypothetical protein